MASEKQYTRLRAEEGAELEDRLPLWRKLCFAVGGAPYQITATVMGFFLSIFLLEVAQIEPYQVSIVLFSGKAWDAVTDPVCGYLVQRTNTRWGKMRPWILFSMPLACTAYFFLFYVPDLSQDAKVAYYLVMYCSFQGLVSALHVPYTALTMYVTTSQAERDSLTSYRMGSEAVGVLLGVLIQGQLVSRYRSAGDCDAKTAGSLEDQKWSYMTGSLIVVGLYFVCAVVVFFGSKEKEGIVHEKADLSCSDVRTALTFTPYLKAAITFLFLSLAISIVQGNLALYCTHTLNMAKDFTYFVVVLLGVSIVSMPLWQLFLLRCGKKTAWATGMVIFIPALISQLYLPPDNRPLLYVVMVLAGLSVAVSLLLPWSVLPDILDLFMLEHNTRKDAIFYSFYVFFNKLAIGLGLAASQVALQVGGYVSGECRQSEEVAMTLRLLVAPGPTVLVLLALLVLWRYPITEAKRLAIRQEVLDRRIRQETRTETEDTVSVSYESIGNSLTASHQF